MVRFRHSRPRHPRHCPGLQPGGAGAERRAEPAHAGGLSMAEPLLSLRGLTVRLPKGADREFALQDVDLDLARGEILCVVGESGSGKSLTATAIMGLLPAPRVRLERGSIRFEGEELTTLSPTRMRAIRGARIGMIFQEPMTALNPLMPVGRQIEEVLE